MRWTKAVFAALVLAVMCSPACKKEGGAAGDNAKKTHASIVKSAIDSMRNVSASLNGISDASSAQQATTVLQNETSNLQRLRVDLASLGNASSAEKQRVKQQSQDMVNQSQAVQRAVAKAVQLIQQGQFPQDVATNLANAGKAYGQAMADFGQQSTPLFD